MKKFKALIHTRYGYITVHYKESIQAGVKWIDALFNDDDKVWSKYFLSNDDFKYYLENRLKMDKLIEMNGKQLKESVEYV